MSFHDSGAGAGRAIRLRRPRLLIPVALTVVAVIALFMVFAGLWTDRLWFDSIGFASVFQTLLFTEVTLFLLGGGLMAAIVGANVYLAHRLRPVYVDTVLGGQNGVDRYRMSVDPYKKPIFWVGLGILFLIAGSSIRGQWNTWLLFINQTPFGKADAQFGMDIAFFTFTWPFLRLVLDFLFAAVVVAALASLAVHYLYGGLRLQPGTPRAERGTRAHLSALIGVFVLLKAAAYWLDRYGLAFSTNGYVEGPSYTDVHAMLPAKTILAIIALICAALFFVGIVRPGGMIPGVALGLLVLAAVLVGGLYPFLIDQFRVAPNQKAAEAPFIQRNIDSTRHAFNIDDDQVKVEGYNAQTQAKSEELKNEASTISGVRVLDPTVVSTTYRVQQQIRDFYEFPQSLDIDRYPTEEGAGDTVVSVRELAGPPDSQDSWINRHLVYTHGYGFVAAPGNEVDAKGSPNYDAKDMPVEGSLVEAAGGLKYPQVYFGERSENYAIVGGPKKLELDYPSSTAGGEAKTSYTGKGGVPLDSMFNRLLFLAKYGEANFFLNSDINDQSRILFDRTPRERVQKAAPYLTVDSDPYPAMVNGRIKWILDAYTTSDRVPYSQSVNIEDATSDTATQTTGLRQPREKINYMRNSVKAVVDSYDGTVDLYSWDSKDPVLKTWMNAFPGTVKAKSEISPELKAHMRYPIDMFKVQRAMLSRYHIKSADEFYGGQAFWDVPADPTKEGDTSQPPYYLSLKMPNDDAPKFSLTTSFVPRGRPNVAAFMAADANPGDNYGKIRILQLPSNTAIEGPGNAHNSMSTEFREALNQAKIGGTRVINGNLLILPFGGGLLYVEPVYVQAKETESFPTLQFVLARFGGKGALGTDVDDALGQIFEGETTPTTPKETDGKGDTGTMSAAVRDAIEKAQKAYNAGQEALKKNDWEAYGKAQEELKEALNELAQARNTPASTKEPEESPTSTPAPTETPSN